MESRGRQSFGRVLRAYREAAGLTQAELAERAGLTANAIGMLERGERRQPQAYTVRQLVGALQLAEADRARLLASAARATTEEWRGTPISGHDDLPEGESAAGGSLPAPVTRLVGREREIAEVRWLLAEARLVTLTGVGGTGKTRLAIEVARRSGGAFPGGTCFVSLAPLDNPDLVAYAIERHLGAAQAPGATPLERMASHIGDRSFLLVLDNLEQVVEAGPLIGALLSSAPNLRVLATSRVLLRLYGEQEYRVPPLSLAGNGEPAEAVRLFIQAARAARPDVVLEGPALAVVAEICARLDGLPLAIELAATRTRFFAPAELLERLAHRLEPLTGGARDRPARQQTLRRTFDWSYHLLSTEQQRIFTRLGVFAGSFDASAAAAVVVAGGSAEAALEGLTGLFESGLLERAKRPGARLRFALLQTVREYAQARLAETGELAAAQARHAEWYLALAEAAAPALRGPEQLAWLDRLETEQDNLRAALQWAEARGDAATGLRFAVALGPFWDARGHLSEGRRWLDRLLAQSTAGAVPANLRARALLATGRLAQWQADLDAADTLLRASIACSRSLGDRRTTAEALTYLGMVRRRQGDFAASTQVLEESLAMLREENDAAGLALARLTLGVTLGNQGGIDRAVALLEESLAGFRALGDVRWKAITLTMLGNVLLVQGNLRRAAEHIAQGLSGHLMVGDRAFAIHGLLGLAAMCAAQSQPRRAARLLGAIDGLCASLGAALAPVNRRKYERTVAIVRRELDAVEFERAVRAGQALTLEQAVAESAILRRRPLVVDDTEYLRYPLSIVEMERGSGGEATSPECDVVPHL